MVLEALVAARREFIVVGFIVVVDGMWMEDGSSFVRVQRLRHHTSLVPDDAEDFLV